MSNIAKIERPAEQSPASAMMELIGRAATSSDIDVEKLAKLLDMKERWEAGEAKREFDEAMRRFRAGVGPIHKTRKAHNSSYAGLAETISSIKGLMSDCGLSHSWRTEQQNGQVSVTCIVTHVAGHSEHTMLSAEPDKSGSKNSIQAIASTVTYLERYTLYAILGLASTDQDDDGAGAGNAYIDDGQLADLIGLMDELGDKVDRAKLRGWLESEGVKDGDLKYIPPRLYKQVCGLLEGKRRT
jgi:hypothetical protein